MPSKPVGWPNDSKRHFEAKVYGRASPSGKTKPKYSKKSALNSRIKVGMKVGAHRWGYDHAHPDVWLKPHSGKVLAYNDIRAWYGAWMDNGKKIRTQEDADEHIAYQREKGISIEDGEKIPVQWNFVGEDGRTKQVYWETKKNLRPYAEDVRLWKKAREKKRKEEQAQRKQKLEQRYEDEGESSRTTSLKEYKRWRDG
jgi:hypothetical protein